MKRKINITLDENLVKAIDDVRGVINRSNYIELLIREAIRYSRLEKRGGIRPKSRKKYRPRRITA